MRPVVLILMTLFCLCSYHTVAAGFDVEDSLPKSEDKTGYLQVRGKVVNQKRHPIDSMMLVLTDSTGLLIQDTLYTDIKGKYEFRLEYESKYRLYYTGAGGVVDIYLVFNTFVPRTKRKKRTVFQFTFTTLSETEADDSRTIKPILYSTVQFDKRTHLFFQNLNDEGLERLIEEIDESAKGKH